jgi:hypothetical protein
LQWECGKTRDAQDAVPGQIAVKQFDEKSAGFFEEKALFLAAEAQPLFCRKGVSPDALPVARRG